jgi:tetrahydromethanopterin S-methyltransferase subunit F
MMGSWEIVVFGDDDDGAAVEIRGEEVEEEVVTVARRSRWDTGVVSAALSGLRVGVRRG